MNKALSWFKGLFAPGNKNTSMAGVATLAGAAAASYMMYTGMLPATPGNIGNVMTATAAGVGLLAAKDANGTPKPPIVNTAINDLAAAGTKVQGLDPLYGPIKDAVEAAGQKASDEAKLQVALQAAAAITQMVQTPPPPEVQKEA